MNVVAGISVAGLIIGATSIKFFYGEKELEWIATFGAALLTLSFFGGCAAIAYYVALILGML